MDNQANLSNGPASPGSANDRANYPIQEKPLKGRFPRLQRVSGRPILWHYLLALGLVAAASLLCWSLPAALQTRPFLAFWPLVVVAAEFGGIGPGLLATVASALCVYLFFIPPHSELSLHHGVGITVLCLYLAGAVATSVFLGVKQRIRASEQLQGRLIDLAPVAILVRKVDGTITFWSDGAERLYGWRRKEAMGRVCHELLRAEYPVGLEKITEELRRAGKWTGEVRHYSKLGQAIVVQSDWLAQLAPGGEVIELLESNMDITARKGTEETLRQSHERLKKVLEVETVGVMFWDLTTGHMVDANDTFLKMMGYTREDIEARRLTWQELTPPEYIDVSQAEVRKFLATGRVGPYEKEYYRKDRSRQWMVFAGSSLGEGCVEFCVDISDRKKAEEALREREALLRTLTNHARVGMVMVNREHRYVFGNAAYAEVLGLSPGEIVGKRIADLLGETYQTQIRPRLEQAFAGKPVAYELIMPPVRQDQRERVFAVTYDPPVETAHGPCVIVVVVDITDRKEAEVKLRESEQRFRTLADNMSQFAWMADDKGWIFWYNQRWFDYTGTTLEQMQGWGWKQVHHPDHLQRVVTKISRCFETGEIWEDTFPLRGRDGQYRWFLSRAMPIRDGQGKVVRWFGTNTDVTEQVRAEAELRTIKDNLQDLVRERTAQLVEANNNLQTFAHTAAHDLRSPLRAIKGFSAIALEEFSDPLGPEGRSYLNQVTTAASRMDRLLIDLLEFSKLSAAELKLESFSLSQAIREALALQETDLRAKNAEVVVTDPMPQVMGHPATVTLIIVNFISNALKFMTSSVQPHLRIWSETVPGKTCSPAVASAIPSRSGERQVDQSTLTATAATHQATGDAPREPTNLSSTSFVRLYVEDNGIGIPQDQLGKLFKPFQRLHAEEAYAGTGLGLAITRKGAERMNGRVGVKSDLGKGSCFWLELPVPAALAHCKATS